MTTQTVFFGTTSKTHKIRIFNPDINSLVEKPSKTAIFGKKSKCAINGFDQKRTFFRASVLVSVFFVTSVENTSIWNSLKNTFFHFFGRFLKSQILDNFLTSF